MSIFMFILVPVRMLNQGHDVTTEGNKKRTLLLLLLLFLKLAP